MSNEKKMVKKETLILAVFIAFIGGFLAGAGFAVYKLGPEETPHDHQQEANAMSDQESKAIASLEAEVTAKPDNFQLWSRLGNLYYDTDQPQKAIGAYTRSLELHSEDANIWTDLGVMYRRTKQPEKAIEAFEKAIAVDPAHQFSRMNKGIVQLYDLNDAPAAINTWEELLQVHPDAKTANGDSIREFVDHIKEEIKQKSNQ